MECLAEHSDINYIYDRYYRVRHSALDNQEINLVVGRYLKCTQAPSSPILSY